MADYRLGRALHDAACKALGIKPGHGSQTRVAGVVGEMRQNYSRALLGNVNLSAAKVQAWLDAIEQESGVELDVVFLPVGRLAELEQTERKLDILRGD